MFSEFEELKFKNYKSFEEFSSISTLKNINVFIGRNNCGKSSCIDVIEALTDLEKIKARKATIRLVKEFLCNKSGEIVDPSWREENTKYIKNKEIEILYGINDLVFEDTTKNHCFSNEAEIIKTQMERMICDLKCYRLNAERDIVPEQEEKEVSLSENGAGAANLVHHILHFDKYEERLVRVDLLEALNEIMYPDSEFDDITVQKVSGDKWEIFLYENETRYALSKMGSGLKTIILVLLNLLGVPCINLSRAFSIKPIGL